MNKKWNMFFTILITTSIVQPLCASTEAEKMYQNIMDTFVTVCPVENSEQRLEALYDSLAEVRCLKRKAELDFFDSQRGMSTEEAFCGGMLAIASAAFLLAIPFGDSKKRMVDLFFGIMSGGSSLAVFTHRLVGCYLAKKELAKLNAVISKLEAARIELLETSKITQKSA